MDFWQKFKGLQWYMFASGASLMLALWQIYAHRLGESAVSGFFLMFFLARSLPSNKEEL